MTETEDALAKNLDDREELIEDNSKNNKKKFIISFVVILMIFIIILLILIFTVFKKDNESETKYEGDTELDTISSEELNKARKSFKQLNYTDEKDSTKILSYNLFIPENYTKEEQYPLMLFISDKSLVGKELTAPLTETVGGPIWATDTVQKKHKCFVLVPQYEEGIISSSGNKSIYVNITINLISNLTREYSIDQNRIYGTGQSMGAMTTLFLLANKNLFAAGLIADGHWLIEELYGLLNATFTFCAAEGDPNPFNSQNEVKQYFDSINVTYGSLDLINARENIDLLNDKAKKMYELGYKQNFISYAKGTVFPPGSEQKSEHMASFKYAYRIETVRDWIFDQVKGK